jgi:hypothetical protein
VLNEKNIKPEYILIALLIFIIVFLIYISVNFKRKNAALEQELFVQSFFENENDEIIQNEIMD